MQEIVRTRLTKLPGVRGLTALEVHSESAATRLLHVHTKLLLDMDKPLREALAIVRRARASLEELEIPVHKVEAGDAAKPAADALWRVSQADVQLEAQPL
ncbi:hypothetical protein EON62_00020 [archaeon]|nr:MAG: hypothetical protein EON62_00020 [archaeon]